MKSPRLAHTTVMGPLLATYLAVCLGVPCASASPTPTVNSCASGPQTMPAEIAILCDNTLRIDKITWSNWDAIRASGRGTEFLVVCEPSCATGTPIYTPVAISLEGARAPDFQFNTATITSLTTGEVHSYPLGG